VFGLQVSEEVHLIGPALAGTVEVRASALGLAESRACGLAILAGFGVLAHVVFLGDFA
jgi:hypothetical protein